jgi:hypothetical protein
MPRFSAGTRSTGGGSTTLPVGSLYATNPGGGRLREFGVFNTTSAVVAVKLVRLLSLGTPGTALTRSPHLEPMTANLQAFDTHTVAPTLGNDLGYRAQLAAVVGSGTIWTFGDTGLVIQPNTIYGIGLIVATGTGQPLDWYAAWDEGTDDPPAPTIQGEADRRGLLVSPNSFNELSEKLDQVIEELTLIRFALD